MQTKFFPLIALVTVALMVGCTQTGSSSDGIGGGATHAGQTNAYYGGNGASFPGWVAYNGTGAQTDVVGQALCFQDPDGKKKAEVAFPATITGNQISINESQSCAVFTGTGPAIPCVYTATGTLTVGADNVIRGSGQIQFSGCNMAPGTWNTALNPV